MAKLLRNLYSNHQLCIDFPDDAKFERHDYDKQNNLKQLKEIIGLKFNTVLFDNMSIKNLRAGVKLAKKHYETEASGNINLKIVKSVAATGVNRISVGNITHSAPAIDFKLEI